MLCTTDGLTDREIKEALSFMVTSTIKKELLENKSNKDEDPHLENYKVPL